MKKLTIGLIILICVPILYIGIHRIVYFSDYKRINVLNTETYKLKTDIPKQYWQKKQYPFNCSFQGHVSPNGEISGLLSGKVQGVPIFGAISGKIQGNAASGRWDAQALMADDGNWQAKSSGQ